MNMLRLLPLLALWACLPAWAQTGSPDADAQAERQNSIQTERARIASERKKIEARFTAEQTACYKKFAVTGCIDDSRAWRREVLADLRRQEILLNDAERRRKGGEELDKLEQKRIEKAEENAPEPRERQHKASPPPKPQGERKAASPSSDPADRAAYQNSLQRKTEHQAQQAQQRAERAAQSAQEEQRYADKLREAAENKERKRKRLQENPGKGKPLPDPPAS